MNPESVGVPKSQEPEPTSSESSSDDSVASNDNEEEINLVTDKLPEDKYLLQQKWLENESYTVSQVLL